MSDSHIRLVGVYNADGGIKGELTYVFGKLRGVTHCALCDISHGNGVVAKKSWKAMLCHVPYPLKAVHLNEMDEATALLVSRENAPVVVYLDNMNPTNNRILLNSQELEACGKNPETFLAKINESLLI